MRVQGVQERAENTALRGFSGEEGLQWGGDFSAYSDHLPSAC